MRVRYSTLWMLRTQLLGYLKRKPYGKLGVLMLVFINWIVSTLTIGHGSLYLERGASYKPSLSGVDTELHGALRPM